MLQPKQKKWISPEPGDSKRTLWTSVQKLLRWTIVILHRLQDKIELPGITDDYQIGWKCPYRHIDRLTRKYEYMGPAWYQREIDIPKEWKGKQIFLYFERTHWLSSVYICKADLTYFGGEAASQKDYISVPHNHDITKHVKPGEKHLLTVCVDNRFQYQTHKWNHAHTEFTQINWTEFWRHQACGG